MQRCPRTRTASAHDEPPRSSAIDLSHRGAAQRHRSPGSADRRCDRAEARQRRKVCPIQHGSPITYAKLHLYSEMVYKLSRCTWAVVHPAVTPVGPADPPPSVASEMPQRSSRPRTAVIPTVCTVRSGGVRHPPRYRSSESLPRSCRYSAANPSSATAHWCTRPSRLPRCRRRCGRITCSPPARCCCRSSL